MKPKLREFHLAPRQPQNTIEIGVNLHLSPLVGEAQDNELKDNGKEATTMTIQITKPEVEALITQRLQSGAFQDAEDVILQALQSLPPKPLTTLPPDAAHSHRSLREVFESARGLADDVDFIRDPSTGRTVDLA